MIVCSLPRCGATRFCLDLQEKVGLQFVGELHPIHIGNNRKSEVHETRFQQSFTSEEFADLIHYNKDHIVLINQHSYLKANRASFIVLRKNMKNAALSLANFLIKMYPSMKPAGIMQQLNLMYNDYVALKAYVDKYWDKREIVWYEDYYDKSETNTPLLDAHPARGAILKEIDTLWDTHLTGDTF